MTDPTARFAAHIRDTWYYAGCDVTSAAPGTVEVGLPPRFPVSAFCADISAPPFNATADILCFGDGGARAVCTLHNIQGEPPPPPDRPNRCSPWIATSAIILAVVAVGARMAAGAGDIIACTTVDECMRQFTPTQ